MSGATATAPRRGEVGLAAGEPGEGLRLWPHALRLWPHVLPLSRLGEAAASDLSPAGRGKQGRDLSAAGRGDA
jgi:hypothetical protein